MVFWSLWKMILNILAHVIFPTDGLKPYETQMEWYSKILVSNLSRPLDSMKCWSYLNFTKKYHFKFFSFRRLLVTRIHHQIFINLNIESILCLLRKTIFFLHLISILKQQNLCQSNVPPSYHILALLARQFIQDGS